MNIYLSDDQVVVISEALKLYHTYLKQGSQEEDLEHFECFIIDEELIEALDKYTEEYNYPGTKLRSLKDIVNE